MSEIAVGKVLKEVREGELGLKQKIITIKAHVCESLVSEWENGKKLISTSLLPVVAKAVNSGRFYMALKYYASGGVSAPYLNGKKVDNHRLTFALKLKEELTEALEATEKIIVILLIPPEEITDGQRRQIEDWMIEAIEAHTASENTLARIAKVYDIDLVELYDRHHQELIDKELLQKEKGFGTAA